MNSVYVAWTFPHTADESARFFRFVNFMSYTVVHLLLYWVPFPWFHFNFLFPMIKIMKLANLAWQFSWTAAVSLNFHFFCKSPSGKKWWEFDGRFYLSHVFIVENCGFIHRLHVIQIPSHLILFLMIETTDNDQQTAHSWSEHSYEWLFNLRSFFEFVNLIPRNKNDLISRSCLLVWLIISFVRRFRLWDCSFVHRFRLILNPFHPISNFWNNEQWMTHSFFERCYQQLSNRRKLFITSVDSES